METQNKKMDRMKIIRNSDVEILDFICELIDARVVFDLQDFIDKSNNKPGVLLRYSTYDHLFILFVYKSPLVLQGDGNNLTMYASHDLRELTTYFETLFDSTQKGTVINNALHDILGLLYKRTNMVNSIPDWMG